jgi:hypothetical protein
MATSDMAFIAFKANKALSKKLDELRRLAGGRSRSVILRYLVAAAKPEDLPSSWRQEVPDSEKALLAMVEGRES